MSLPVIPLAPLLLDLSTPAYCTSRSETVRALHDACVTHGFFYLDLTGYISESKALELRQLAQEFFDLPTEEKAKIWIGNEDWARGYQKLGENVTQGKADAHEAIDFYAPSPFPCSSSASKSGPKPALSGRNQWPPNSQFRYKFSQWVERMKELGLIVMEAMAEGLGMTREEWLRDLRPKVDDSFWVLRVIGYPPLPQDHDGFSCGAHKDYGCLTFLWADPTPNALQVFVPHLSSEAECHVGNGYAQKSSAGLGESVENGLRGTWISADPLPNCIVCNIGEMWEVWTRGLYRSTLHRVMHLGNNYRISLPLFFEPNFDALISPLPGVDRLLDAIRESDTKDEAHARAVTAKSQTYSPVVYGEFLLKKVGGNFDKENEGKGRYD